MIRLRGLADFNNFVAGRQDRDTRLRIDGDRFAAGHGKQGDVGVAQPLSGFELDRSGSGLYPTRIEVVARRVRPLGANAIAVQTLDVLNHENRVGAFGERGPSHDFHRLARTHRRTLIVFAGANFADDLKLSRKVGRTHGESVASRAREGWIVAVGGDGLGQDASVGLERGKPFGGGRRSMRGDFAKDGFSGFVERQGHGSGIGLPLSQTCPGGCRKHAAAGNTRADFGSR